MNKKFPVKAVIITVILLLVGVLGVLGMNTVRTYLSGASGESLAKNVLAKPSEDGKSAIISWTTDKATMGVVEYGTVPASLLLRSPESEETTTHSVTLSNLKPATTYYYDIKIGEQVSNSEDGTPFRFTTKGTKNLTPTVMVTPTVAAVPTSAVGSTSSALNCDRTTDYNKDGVVNSLDYVSCSRGGIKVSTPTPTTDKCANPADLNKDGVVNSLDRIKCLQSQ